MYQLVKQNAPDVQRPQALYRDDELQRDGKFAETRAEEGENLDLSISAMIRLLT